MKKNESLKFSNFAFTLAEVLIVIAIIGTVAALTLPNLNDKYSEDKTIVKLQKLQNELNSAHRQSVLKYGNYDEWFASNETDANKITEYRDRLVEFLDISRTNTSFPLSGLSNYTNYELKDGTLIAVSADANGVCNVIVATEGMNGVHSGKNIFGFVLNPNTDSVLPYGKGEDRDANNAFYVTNNNLLYATNWVLTNENMDYLRCAASLNWESKTTCD